jgi:hypothetical protein
VRWNIGTRARRVHPTFDRTGPVPALYFPAASDYKLDPEIDPDADLFRACHR